MDTADVLFIASDPREFSGVLRFWESVRPVKLAVHWSRQGLRKGRRAVAVANGAGAERARLAGTTVAARIVCNVGFCGALDPALRIGDIVAAGEPPRTGLAFVAGRLICLDHVAQTVAEKRLLRAQGGTAVDMESAGVPGAYLIKSVSDLADEGFENNFNEALLPDGRISTSRLLRSAVRKPFVRFPELLRLRRRTSLAAETLGSFLNGCDF